MKKLFVITLFVLVSGCMSTKKPNRPTNECHLVQTQISDKKVNDIKDLTVYVLKIDYRIYVFEQFNSHQMKEILKHLPANSTLYYDGSGLIFPPPKNQVDDLREFCNKKSIEFIVSPTN